VKIKEVLWRWIKDIAIVSSVVFYLALTIGAFGAMVVKIFWYFMRIL
jgi:hypothetical protein